jgi:hypothetical protein
MPSIESRIAALERAILEQRGEPLPDHLRVLLRGGPVNVLNEHRGGRHATMADLYDVLREWHRGDHESEEQFVARVLAGIDPQNWLMQPARVPSPDA